MMAGKILITGSFGLIGTALCKSLDNNGFQLSELDLRGAGDSLGDVRDLMTVERAMDGCSGVVHLAAVSRVIWGELNPDLCREVNLTGIQNVLAAIRRQEKMPWLIFASSREVYGNAGVLPVRETSLVSPINVYGETKAESEVMITEAGKSWGLPYAILRFSNVFGGIGDYSDRVVPAFFKAAISGAPLRIDGAENTFDFTWLDEVIRAIQLTVNKLENQHTINVPLHLVSGIPTTLKELAQMVIKITKSNSPLMLSRSREYDVSRFFGDPSLAEDILGWRHETPLTDALCQYLLRIQRHGTLADPLPFIQNTLLVQ
jgi:UDP-glucose 4-epimerase